MATTTQTLTYGDTGQTLILEVLEGRASGTPTFVVYRAEDGDEATAEFSGNGTVDAVNTTVDEAAGYTQTNRKQIGLASVASISVGEEYLLTSPTGAYEWVEVTAVDTSNDRVFSRSPLQNDYAVNSTFVGTKITGSVDSTWVADEDNLVSFTAGNPTYRVLWTYEVSGTTYKRYSYLNLVRVAGSHRVVFEDLLGMAPELKTQLPKDFAGNTQRILDEAYQALKLDLKSADIDINAIRDQWVIDELVKRRAIYSLAISGLHPRSVSYSEYVALAQKEYDRVLKSHLQVVNRTMTAIDTDGTAVRRGNPKPIWIR